MFLSRRSKTSNSEASTPDLDDASINLDEADVDVDVDVDATQKPHFLDYDAVPPPEFEESFDMALSFGIGAKPTLSHLDRGSSSSSGEQLKLDKKYERDGEISDYELAASGYTKKEFTQDDNTLHLASASEKVVVGPHERTPTRKGGNASAAAAAAAAAFAKPKHFLDENPIPPDYMLKEEQQHAEHALREHRSLDRNFERQTEQQQHQRRKESSPSSLGGGGAAAGRKSSLERAPSSVGSRSSRGTTGSFTPHEPSYTLSRFLDSDTTTHLIGAGSAANSLPPISASYQYHHQRTPSSGKVAAWSSESFDSRYGTLQLPMATSAELAEVDTLGPKVECVYSLLSMLGSNDPVEMSKKFLDLSRTPETCATLRRSGCIPLLVQLQHSPDATDSNSVRKWSGMALHNVVHSHPDEKAGRREAKVLRLLDQIMDYCNFLKTLLQSGGEAIADDSDRHPLAAISSLMKVSFDEEHRHAMCELGALQAIPALVHLDHAVHGPKPEDQCCNSLRRYALMALTNLTFGDENNKAMLCSQKLFMEALVAQLDCAPDDLLQVTASVLRNLSWRADNNMKAVLNEIGTVTALARAAMKNKSENTLKAILSALWNLSAHCSTNKAEFCAVAGALAFLVDMLTYEGPSKTLKIIENAGGILRNVSSHIAVREHYRQILREHNCLAILLQQLKSESLTVVSNSCGTLWNLSARCPEDQKYLWDNGAVPMLRSLIHSKHAMISEGSSSALKNLLNFRPSIQNQSQLDPIARSMGLKKLPTLNARKQKALEQELGEKAHAETCDNLDIPGNSSTKEHSTNFDTPRHYHSPLAGAVIVAGVVAPSSLSSNQASASRLTRSAMLTKSESRDSVFSAKSDSATYEHLMRSHSASDANRKVAAAQSKPFPATRNAFALPPHEVETTEEQPIDYSVKYNENSTTKTAVSTEIVEDEEANVAVDDSNYATYQETDLDQPTDFSLRYGEHQIESDIDVTPPETAASVANPASIVTTTAATIQSTGQQVSGGDSEADGVVGGQEILLILEDSVKCYQTEDTPYVISNAASVTDLRQTTREGAEGSSENQVGNQSKTTASAVATTSAAPTAYAKKHQRSNHGNTAAYGCGGSFTPEKPINYCEEGTPGYFSRYESLSSLDESPPQANASGNKDKKSAAAVTVCADDVKTTEEQAPGTKDKPHASSSSSSIEATSNAGTLADIQTKQQQLQQNVVDAPQLNAANQTQINSALETPLMFSRHSSMDSLAEEEEDVGACDDKSSVVSDFSRLASGVISPSEIPDSPTQSMPQSPRRNSASGQTSGFRVTAGLVRGSGESKRPPLRSVFEDNLNTFHEESTPAQFSCATSLSNLSILDDENNSPPVGAKQQLSASDASGLTVENVSLQANIISEGEEEEESVANNDDLLLANCINMGMNRTGLPSSSSSNFANARKTVAKLSNITSSSSHPQEQQTMSADEPRRYYTEDTPALLSKVGSNTNLSVISICSSNNDPTSKDDAVYEATTQAASESRQAETTNFNRHSLNLSDDVSSNASESGAATGQSFDLLQQCIRDGMKKPSACKPKITATAAIDPIAMMRRGGGSILPPYLAVSDEMNKFLVEDSPCNFSVVSGLSNLTVGSSLVGPAVQLQGNGSINDGANATAEAVLPSEQAPPTQPPQEEVRRREQRWQDDSLSSLSIDSEDDTNLLIQAIAAGCNRPKSNLGFSSTTNALTNKRSTSLSASQPIPINISATSASSLNSSATARNYHRHQHQQQHQQLQQLTSKNLNQNGNDSYSSSDSNDNQSKSLFELCILTGMNKARDGAAATATNNSRSNQQQAQHAAAALTALGHHHSRVKSHLKGHATQSNPNLKQFDSIAAPLVQHMPTSASSSAAMHHQQHHKSHTPNRHLRERERKDEKLLLECINTGISKKISSSSNSSSAGRGVVPTGLGWAASDNTNNAPQMPMQMQRRRGGGGEHESAFETSSRLFSASCAVPKNVQATSAAAREAYRPTALHITSTNANSANSTPTTAAALTPPPPRTSRAAPGVEKNENHTQRPGYNATTTNITVRNAENEEEEENQQSINREDIITNGYRENQREEPAEETADAERAQSHGNIHATTKTNSIGCKLELIDYDDDNDVELSNSLSLDNITTATTNSDDSNASNESFIMETTVSLDVEQHTALTTQLPRTADKHKDPDLMLKSVERLTLEFVSSAVQLRTTAAAAITTGVNSGSGGDSTTTNEQHSNKQRGSISGGGSNSNNTWNEDTCPNDVSFPSVSVSAPIVASLNYDDDEEDDDADEEQATEADHRELHDFAEITPTNEEQPLQPSLVFVYGGGGVVPGDETDLYTNQTQPNSLETETETDTLIQDTNHTDFMETATNTRTQSSSSGSGINFKLGGKVQSAAAVATSRHNLFFNSSSGGGGGSTSAMTHSTIIAIEARALAENLAAEGAEADDDYEFNAGDPLTFNINNMHNNNYNDNQSNSLLDLDQIRPPSGMESLNISGYYQETASQPNSLRGAGGAGFPSPFSCSKSPKFPRKSLPAGFVARRALGQLPAHLAGSTESVNSSCQLLLDNIKPPSLMDELLDSMISVASIQSEIADADAAAGGCCDSTSMGTTVSLSNYETAAGENFEDDFEDNTITLQSCYDELLPRDDADDDEDAGTPLPAADFHFSSAESTPKKSPASPADRNGGGSGSCCYNNGVKRTLTPKQKRKLAKDRFKTYTIAADIVLSGEREPEELAQPDDVLQIEIVAAAAAATVELSSPARQLSASASRRQATATQERYKTQTIVYQLPELKLNDANGADECASDDDDDDEISSIRAITKQFKFITAPAVSVPLKNNVGGLASRVFVAPALPSPQQQAFDGDLNSLEYDDQNSETESCHGQLSDDERSPPPNNLSQVTLAATETAKLEAAVLKARILKPGEVAVFKEHLEETKVVRGRKKPSYVSPYSMQYQRGSNSSGNNSTTAAATRLATNKLITPTTAHTSVFRKRNSNLPGAATNTKPTLKKKTTTTTAATAPAVEATTTAAPTANGGGLERQGTFVQDEPTIAAIQMPVVVAPAVATASPSTSLQSSPTRSASRLPTKRQNIPAAKPLKSTTTAPVASAAIRRTPPQKTATTTTPPQRSNSNSSIRRTNKTNAARVAVLAARVSTTTPPSRSNSSLNALPAAAAAAAPAAVSTAKINQAQSRIAGIWRRVDEAKTKQQQQTQKTQHTTNLGASSGSGKKAAAAATVSSSSHTNKSSAAAQQQQQQQQQNQKLIRSTTFERAPAALPATAVATKIGGARHVGVAMTTTTTMPAMRREQIVGCIARK